MPKLELLIRKLSRTFRMLQLSVGRNEPVVKTEVITWPANGLKLVDIVTESQVTLLCVMQGHWRWEGQSTPLQGSVSEVATLLLCWFHSEPACMKNSPQANNLSLSHLLSNPADFWAERLSWHAEIWISSAEGQATTTQSQILLNKLVEHCLLLSTQRGEANGSMSAGSHPDQGQTHSQFG